MEKFSQDTPSQSKVEEMLRQRIGLNPESVGSRSILRAVKRGMRSGRMQGLSDYVKGLQNNPELFNSLVESVVVPETSFFRNRASFVFLRQWISQKWLTYRNNHQAEAASAYAGFQHPSTASASVKTPNKQPGRIPKQIPKRILRVLSIPCSTGEEPYSIAITLQEEGLSLSDFHIDAVDISEQAIAKAKKGIYSPYAFRRHSYREDNQYFTLNTISSTSPTQSQKRVVQRYVLNNNIRDKVTFMQGNLLEPGLLAHQRPYDIVFCRNLLIYFDKPARDRAMTFLNRVLKPGGLLFLGYAETGLIDKNDYKPVPYPQTFAYYRREKPLSPSEEKAPTPPRLSDALLRAQKNNLTQQSSAQFEQPATESGQGTKQPSLSRAQQRADKGDIPSAIALCDAYLLHSPADASAHLLRGELHLAADELAAAESCFEKAIYLNSQLVEALTHLMLIKETQNALQEAAIIKERIRRIQQSSG